MTDTVTSKRRSEIMANIRSKGMRPEMLARRLVHSMGYRYRLHRSDLPGKPDLAFPCQRKVIFVHGCFWHQHIYPGCKIARLPKLARNAARDAEHQAALTALHWDALVVWECETEDGGKLKETLGHFLRPR